MNKSIKCNDCGKEIVKSVFIINGVNYCLDCYKKSKRGVSDAKSKI